MSGKEKFYEILDIVLHDNDMNLSDIHLENLDEEAMQHFYDQAERIPDEELETFAVGEETDANRITSKYKAHGLSNFLNSLV